MSLKRMRRIVSGKDTRNRFVLTARSAGVSHLAKLLLLLVILAVTSSTQAFAQSPVVSLSPTSLSFGGGLAGGSAIMLTLTVKNTGAGRLNFSAIGVTGSNSAQFTIQPSSTCSVGNPVSPGASCMLNVAFSAGNNFGPFGRANDYGTLTLTDDAANSPQSVPLSGIGVTNTDYLSSTNFAYGPLSVGSSSSKNLILTNLGTNGLNISNIAVSGDFSFTNKCPSPVPSQTSCLIRVTFTPQSIGTRAGWLTLTDDSGYGPQYVQLFGSGTSGTAQLSTGSAAFSSQAMGTTSAAQTVTLSNTGAAALNIVSIVASGDYVQSSNCGNLLGAGGNCTITVNFVPTWSGSRPGALIIHDSDPSNLQTVLLSGTGLAPSSTVSLSSYLATLTIGQTLQLQATVQNSSDGVTWAVDGIPGGNSNVGTVSASGLYTSPSSAGTHRVTAIGVDDPSQTATATIVVDNYPGVLTYHDDNTRSGQNANELALNTANVNVTQFGKVFSYSVDGYVFAQPLYVEGLNLPGIGPRNVVFVATEHDSVYAFDADGLSATPYWQVSFINPGGGVTSVPTKLVGSTVYPEIGITSTPVIDTVSNTIYVVANTKEGNKSVYRLHALDLSTGAEKFGGPVVIQASVPGNGIDASNGMVTFNSIRQGQRAGLLLANGVVYIAFADRGPDLPPFHGWLLGYDAQSLQQVGVFNTTPNGYAGGIWGSGDGPAADALGNIYVSSGNGTFDANTGGNDYGDCLLELSLNEGSLVPTAYFSPFDQNYLMTHDLDLASGGWVLLPDQSAPHTHIIAAAGKEGAIYLLDRDNPGAFNAGADNQIVQSIRSPQNHQFYSTPAFWQNHLYYWSVGGSLQDYWLANELLSSTPIAFNNTIFGWGATPSVSANSGVNGIVWAVDNTLAFASGGGTGPAVLHAYDAANVATELYNSNQAQGGRDTPGWAVRFATPTVANGRVYVGGQYQLTVYGLLPGIQP